MKTILFTCTLLLATLFTRSQTIMRMEDNVSATFVLDRTVILKHGSINYFELSFDKKSDYYAKLIFGKQRFDITHYKSSDGTVLGSKYPIFKTTEYFKLVEKKGYQETFELKRDVGSMIEDYKVAINHELGTIQVMLSTSTNNGKTWNIIYSGVGNF